MPNLKLSREQLQKFLPDHDAIRKFEKMLEFVGESPDALAELLALISSIKRVNVAEINTRLAELEAGTGRIRDQSGVSNRIGDIEAQLARRPDLTAIIARIEALEQTARRRENITLLLQRIENLEKLIGV